MRIYRIAPVETGFQVVEDLPDGRDSRVGGFSTEADARTWLDSFLVLMKLLDCMAGQPTPYANDTAKILG
jgi:hypothetical protein